MRRFPSPLRALGLLAACTLTFGPSALAQDSAPDGDAPSAASTSAASTSAASTSAASTSAASTSAASTADDDAEDGAAADPATGKKREKSEKDETQTNARLAPGGVVAGGSTFPLHIQVTVDNTVNNGIFAPGYQRVPMWSSSLNIRPSAMLPKPDWAPRMILTGSINFSVENWLPASYNMMATYDRVVAVDDPILAVIMPSFFVEPLTGIRASAVLSARAPLSLFSRQQNQITNAGGAVQFAWFGPATPVGSFFAQYTPGARFSAYSQAGPSVPCDSPITQPLPGGANNPINGLDTVPIFYGREEQVLPNGECLLAGRQLMGSITNPVNVGWNSGNHNVTVGMAWTHSFFRGLKNDPGLSSPFSSGQSFQESSSTAIFYNYTVPVDFNMFLTTGIYSFQLNAYDNRGFLRFPFWDFMTPSNNFSGFFFDVTVGI